MSVPSQLSPGDVRTLQTIMKFMAGRGSYSYLELGSYLGGSLQWHLTEPACDRVVSVDRRSTAKILDERDIDYAYSVTTDQMLDVLRKNNLPLLKLHTIDGTSADLEGMASFDLCFIDAEHTNRAVLEDGLRCHAVMRPDSIIMFHDDWIVYQGIESLEQHFQQNNTSVAKHKIAQCDITVLVFGSLMEPFAEVMQQQFRSWDQLVAEAQKRLPTHKQGTNQ